MELIILLQLLIFCLQVSLIQKRERVQQELQESLELKDIDVQEEKRKRRKFSEVLEDKLIITYT